VAVIGGGISGYVERTLLQNFFGQVAYSIPATVYVGLATSQPLDVSNFGNSVTYGTASLVDSQNYFPYNLAGAWVIAGASTGTVLSNTVNTVTLTGSWTGGTPSTGTQYDISFFSEPSGNNYSRVTVTNNTTNFVEATTAGSQTNYSGIVVNNGLAINFPNASGAGWGQVVSAFVSDNSVRNQGHILYAQPLATPQFVLGGQTVAIPKGVFGLGFK
jgi:hypothetical protein